MLFNSNVFIFGFLPVALLGYYLLGHVRPRLAAAWLVLCSLAFYAYWNVAFVLLLLGSACFNCLCGRAINARQEHPRQQSALLVVGVVANLGLLFYYKYFF